MVWDSTMAGRASIEVGLLESIIPSDRKESALRLFHENSYQLNGACIYSSLVCTLYHQSLFHSFQWCIRLLTLLYLYPTYTTQYISGILDKVMGEEPHHGMNWSPASKKNFTSNIDRKKDFTKVAKAMSKSTGACQAYYYCSFKNTVSLSLLLSSLIHISFVTKRQWYILLKRHLSPCSVSTWN